MEGKFQLHSVLLSKKILQDFRILCYFSLFTLMDFQYFRMMNIFKILSNNIILTTTAMKAGFSFHKVETILKHMQDEAKK